MAEALSPEIVKEVDAAIREIRNSSGAYLFKKTVGGYRFHLTFDVRHGCLWRIMIMDDKSDATSNAIAEKFWGAFL